VKRILVPMPDHLRKPRKPRGPRPNRKRPPDNRDRSKFATSPFIAIDGEGFSEGVIQTVSIEGHEYVYQPHYYSLLAASDGREDYCLSGRLSSQRCLEFLFNVSSANPRGIFVIFSGGYDVTQFLGHDIKRSEAKELMESAKSDTNHLDITRGGYDYRIKIVPRKNLTISRWTAKTPKYKFNPKSGRSSKTPHETFVLWDVWGFFQDSFSEVMRKWIPDDVDYQFIRQMKEKRGNSELFNRDEMDVIRKYNAAELRCLVAIMNRVRSAIEALGLKVTRWDGAGAIAGAMNQKHNVKASKAPDYTPAFDAACHAYSGGHIEVCKIGFHFGEVHHYDVNSAYPAEFINLPDLASGRWRHSSDAIGDQPPEGFTLVYVQYNFREGLPFYPLFFRERDGTILYPQYGEGWYWFPEYTAAREYFLQHGGTCFRVLEWWHYASDAPRPFAWVRDYYARRQHLVADAKRRAIENGEEKIIKLGLNSLYGKTMQQVGARMVGDEFKPPAYFQIEWGGYVTSGCRAKLMRAATQNPHSIIAFATDGLFSTEPLLLDCPTEKVLGAWEYQSHAGITMVMPGVYWLHSVDELGDLKSRHYARGFDKKTMGNPTIVHQAWARGQDEIAMETTRLIGLGTAVSSKHFWKMRGCFVSSSRMLRLDGLNSKRLAITVSSSKPHRGLVAIDPKEPDASMGTCSKPYDIKFLTTPLEDAQSRAEDEAEREALDAAEA
jgi:hypothetical protein